MKTSIISTVVMAGSLLIAGGCATTRGLTGVAQPAISYRCSLDDLTCALVASAAAESSAEGFPVIQVPAGSPSNLVFLPGDYRTIFFSTEVPTVGGFALIDPRLLPHVSALEVYRAAGIIRVNWRSGGQDIRDGDFVSLIVSQFEQAGGL